MAQHRRVSFAAWLAAAALGTSSVGASSVWAQGEQCGSNPRLGVLEDAGTGTAAYPAKGFRGKVIIAMDACDRGRIEAASEAGALALVPATLNAGRHYIHANYDLEVCSLPNASDLPGARFRLKFTANDPAANLAYVTTLARDTEKPTLTTTSVPRKGTKVSAGDRIRVRMEASEEYVEGTRTGWQTGIKRIQLRDESRGEDVVPHFEDAGPAKPCGQKMWKQWIEVTYTVRPNPPPVIRLVATAWDHGGNKDTDVGEFPTADWYGTFEMESAGRYRTRAEIKLDRDDRGNLTGTMVGEQWVDYSWNGGKCFQRTIRPNRFRVSLVGAYTEGRSFKVFIKEIEESRLQEERGCEGSASVRMEFSFKTHIWGAEALLGTPSPLGEGQVRADGTRYYKFEHPPTTAAVTLRPAR
jgi:hypothetical protein